MKITAIFSLLIIFMFLHLDTIESRTDRKIQDQRANDGESTWCVAKPSADNEKLRQNIDYSCSRDGVDCAAIQPGGSCYHPDSIVSHASYAMNLYFKTTGKHSWDCYFDDTALLVSKDPSFGTCKYP